MRDDSVSGAWRLRIRGVVQGVGFRPFVYRLARRHGLRGWVLNDPGGVSVHLEGGDLQPFLHDLRAELPPAAVLEDLQVTAVASEGFADFQIVHSEAGGEKVTRISADLAPCPDCLREMRDPADRRHRYPYINCTNCGPRYSIVLGLPYDRPNTTMRAWPLCPACQRDYEDPLDRRYHAQPVACPACGPQYVLEDRHGWDAIAHAAELLREGKILAVKGVGGYHLMCDARRADVVGALRARKFRKDKPFALLARDPGVAREIVHLTPEDEARLSATARPILLAPARVELPEVAPIPGQLGVMLPSAPLQELLFEAGAPPLLVATSGNRSSEPMETEDVHARQALAALADAFLVGERPIARRVDDSVIFAGSGQVVRRARGLAPGVSAHLPTQTPILAVGADLKNTVTLVVGGQALTSAYIGDLEHLACREAHRQAIADLLALYGLDSADCVVAHDGHPGYASTALALEWPARRRVRVQHHHAHLASVLAEHALWDEAVLGVIFDGTGYGDDGTIWGGEFLHGSLKTGFRRVGHLRPAPLPGGDAAARLPAQAAVGFLTAAGLAVPTAFPAQARRAAGLVGQALQTTSAGRLFDAAAALLGFHGPQTYEAQAASWLEALARTGTGRAPLPFPWDGEVLDWSAALEALLSGTRPAPEAARAFHLGLIVGVTAAVRDLLARTGARRIAVSGGVWHNQLLLSGLAREFGDALLTNRAVPVGDGGVSLGQAALAAFAE